MKNTFIMSLVVASLFFTMILTSCKWGETDHDSEKFDQDAFKKDKYSWREREDDKKGATNSPRRNEKNNEGVNSQKKIGTTDTSATLTPRIQADTSGKNKHLKY